MYVLQYYSSSMMNWLRYSSYNDRAYANFIGAKLVRTKYNHATKYRIVTEAAIAAQQIGGSPMVMSYDMRD